MALGEPGYTTGLGALLFGLIEGPRALIPWSANLFGLLSAGMLLAGVVRLAVLLAVVAVTCGLSAMVFYRRSVLLEGYDWWLASLVVLAVGSLGTWVWRLRTAKTEHCNEQGANDGMIKV